jgi:hypothetical protein
MKGLTSFCVLVAGIVATGCYDKGDSSSSNIPLLRTHFIGMTQVIQGTNASKLKEVWALPASQDVRKQALDKIAAAPFQLWQKSFPNGAQDNPKLIRPLLDDLVSSECFIELNGSGAKYDSVIAVNLDEQRARLWNTNLWQTSLAWKFPTPKAVEGTTGWETHGNGITLQFQQQKNWVLVGWSAGKLKAITSLAESVAKSGRPVPASKGAILQFDADFPALSHYNPLISKFKLPVSQFVISPHRDGESLRTEGKFSLPQPLNWKFEPWVIPTDRIGDPLVSFTLAQGIDPILKAIPGFSDLGLETTPTQVCGWSEGSATFKSFWCFPQPNASNVVRKIVPRIEGFLKHYFEQPPGGLVYATNRSQILWERLPVMMPSVQAAVAGGRECLLVSLVPSADRGKPVPPELMRQFVGRKDLCYYDWEITEARLAQSKVLYQVVDMMHLRTLAPTNAPSLNWFNQAGPKLGNTVTEVTLSGPNELRWVRKSHLGLTGFELATLLRWVDSSAFPLGYQPTPSIRNANSQKAKR